MSDLVEAVRALARVSRLLERSTGDLSLPQYRVLAAIEAGDERASRLAARLALGKPAISATVESLCRRGLIERANDDADQRAMKLQVTTSGRSVLTSVEKDMSTALADLLARVGNAGETTAALAALGPALDELQRERFAQRSRV